MIDSKVEDTMTEGGDVKTPKQVDYMAVTLESLTKNSRWEAKMRGKFSLVKQDKKSAKDRQIASVIFLLYKKYSIK